MRNLWIVFAASGEGVGGANDEWREKAGDNNRIQRPRGNHSMGKYLLYKMDQQGIRE